MGTNIRFRPRIAKLKNVNAVGGNKLARNTEARCGLIAFGFETAYFSEARMVLRQRKVDFGASAQKS